LGIHLPLTEEERKSLRKNKIKIAEIHQLSIEDFMEKAAISYDRAKQLKGLAAFQQIRSIGYEMAKKLVYCGYYSLSDVKDKDWAILYDELEKKLGYWMDPCVEDQVMCVIHHANHPQSNKQWFHFTEERKQYRKVHGYPATRPALAWYDVK